MSATMKVEIHLDAEDTIAFQVRDHWSWYAVAITVDERTIAHVYCETPDQVRAFVPDFRSECEQAADEAIIAPLVAACEEAHGPAMAEAGPFQVGDKVRVLRVSGITDEPYESHVISTDFREGELLVRAQHGVGWEYDNERVWSVRPDDVELIAPAETAEVPA